MQALLCTLSLPHPASVSFSSLSLLALLFLLARCSSWPPSKGKVELPCLSPCAVQRHPCKVLCFSQQVGAVMWLVGAVRSGGGGEDVEREWREILKGDKERERERGVKEMPQTVLPFPLVCLC